MQQNLQTRQTINRLNGANEQMRRRPVVVDDLSQFPTPQWSQVSSTNWSCVSINDPFDDDTLYLKILIKVCDNVDILKFTNAEELLL